MCIRDSGGAEYQRIRLTTESVGVLHFDQFEAWTHEAGQWRNVAAGATASQSSLWREDYSANTGNNGDLNGDAGPHTNREPNPWWEIDFGEPTACDVLVLFNRLRFFAERMQHLRVFGETANGWKLLFTQTNAQHRTRWGKLVLDAIDNRLDAQLQAAIMPQAELVSSDSVQSAADSVYFFQQLERIKALRGLLASTRVVNDQLGTAKGQQEPTAQATALTGAIRSGLHAAMPMNLTPAPSDVLLFNVAGFNQVHIRVDPTELKKPADARKAFTSSFFEYDADAESATAASPIETFDYQSVRLETVASVSVEQSGLSLSIDTAKLEEVKWELWGEDEAGAFTLLYDNTAVTRAIFQLTHLLERGDHPFDGLVLGSRALEIEGKYRGGYLFSLYYPTDEPDDAVLDDYLSQIEYRSLLDDCRKSVSRTKHGYARTFMFRDKKIFTSGLQVISDTLNEAGFTNVPFYGTLLGGLRDGSLIDHDDDGDLLMLNDSGSKEEMQEYYDKLYAWLGKKTKWKLYDARNLPGNNVAVAFAHDGEWIHCDLFPTWVEGDSRMVLHEGRGGFVPLPDDLFDIDRLITFEGSTFKIPEKSEELMELIYGNWRTPYRGYMLMFIYQRRQLRQARRAAAAKEAKEAKAAADSNPS